MFGMAEGEKESIGKDHLGGKADISNVEMVAQ